MQNELCFVDHLHISTSTDLGLKSTSHEGSGYDYDADWSDLGAFDFVLTTSVGPQDMFQVETSSGQMIKVDMESRETYLEWEIVGKSTIATLSYAYYNGSDLDKRTALLLSSLPCPARKFAVTVFSIS